MSTPRWNNLSSTHTLLTLAAGSLPEPGAAREEAENAQCLPPSQGSCSAPVPGEEGLRLLPASQSLGFPISQPVAPLVDTLQLLISGLQCD